MTDKTEVPDKPETSDKSKLDKLLKVEILLSNVWFLVKKVTISNANNNWVSSLKVEIKNCHLDLF